MGRSERRTHVLWPLAAACWSLGFRRAGNWISDVRYRLWQRYGWEWI